METIVGLKKVTQTHGDRKIIYEHSTCSEYGTDGQLVNLYITGKTGKSRTTFGHATSSYIRIIPRQMNDIKIMVPFRKVEDIANFVHTPALGRLYPPYDDVPKK